NVPCGPKEIHKATGIPKRLIDHRGLLGRDPEIRRQTDRRRVFWTFVGRDPHAPPLGEPKSLLFWPWCRWGESQNLLHKFGSPPQAGIYMFACFDKLPARETAPDVGDLPGEVIYVGMSKHLSNRPLSAHPNGTKRYNELFGDMKFENLYV